VTNNYTVTAQLPWGAFVTLLIIKYQDKKFTYDVDSL